MTDLQRIRVALTGFPGGPGVSTFYSIDGSATAGRLHTMYTDLAVSMPNSLTIDVQNGGDTIDDVTGNLVGSWSGSALSAIVGGSSAAYAAGVGLQIVWETGTIMDGHRVNGSTFVVPISGAAYQTNGTLVDAFRSAWQTDASAMVASDGTNFCIWHRPRKAKAADGSRPAVTARNGGHAFVIGSHINDKVAFLRSRRD